MLSAKDPPFVDGGSGDKQVARLVEQAARHQIRAASQIRTALRVEARPAPAARRHDLAVRALEHLELARRALERAQEVARDDALRGSLRQHLRRLGSAVQHVNRLASPPEERYDGAG